MNSIEKQLHAAIYDQNIPKVIEISKLLGTINQELSYGGETFTLAQMVCNMYPSRTKGKGDTTVFAHNVIENLIAHGLDVNHTVTDMPSPLMLACNNGCLKTVNVLIRHGADLTYKTPDGNDILYCAIRGNSVEVVKMLLMRGMRPTDMMAFMCDPGSMMEKTLDEYLRADRVKQALEEALHVNNDSETQTAEKSKKRM